MNKKLANEHKTNASNFQTVPAIQNGSPRSSRTLPASRKGSAWSVRLVRILRRHGWFLLALFIGAASYVAFFWYDFLFASPVELYHRTWKACASYIFDEKQLKDWKSFEHRFDKQIKTDDDAVRYANKMLSSLGDPYTYLMSKKECEQLSQRKMGRFVGIGVHIFTVKNKSYLTIKDVIPGSPANRAHLKPGDTILSVAGHSCREMTPMQFSEITRNPSLWYDSQTLRQAQRQANSGSNTRRAVDRSESKSVCLIIERNARKLRLYLTPAAITTDNVEFKHVANRVGLLTVHDFIQADTGNRVIKALEQAKDCSSLIVDLRNNPGGSVTDCLQLASLFLQKGIL